MTFFSHTNWYIAVTSSAANIPPQRRQAIVFVPSSDFFIWTGLLCMVCHAVILVQSVQAKVKPHPRILEDRTGALVPVGVVRCGL